MKQLVLIFAVMTLCMHAEASSYEDRQTVKKIDKGQRIFRNKLQRKCGFTASYWAQQHTKNEWETFQDNGTFKKELATMCPRAVKVVEDKWMEPLYLFAVEYAKDAGNRPRC